MRPALGFELAWILWALSWLGAALWTGRTLKRGTLGAQILYRAVITVGAVLLFHRTSERLGMPMLWHVGYDGAWALVALTAAGFLFAWWARLHLGTLWSGSVTLKEGHRVVESGPYGLVRHPIYTGVILASLSTAIAEATLPALAGGILIALGIAMKARVEEGFLRRELGEAAYDSYAARVPMLIPLWPRHG